MSAVVWAVETFGQLGGALDGSEDGEGQRGCGDAR